ncbi:hypothetical protein [Pseudomonas orientalis]|uniref:Uncharacterized protein n=1 Tax=Pseudomonas orientalis TaxID=76758 RepID=A0A2L0RXX4_9PSED|nr:hypothetical protein [Pseudomonas orientalis]AUZ46868.1 hypothetical protein BOP93_15085 [Pseudomonas orientalis]
MKIVKAISAAWSSRKKKTWAELNDWALILIGLPSFATGTYYLWVATTVTQDLIVWSKHNGLTFEAILVFAFLGSIALSGLYLATVAKRCYGLIVERNFK